MAKAKTNSESSLSKSVADFLTVALPDGSQFTHIPLGGLRDPKTAALLRAEGVRPGAPDFLIIVPPEGLQDLGRGPVHHGRVMFIELKTESGRLSREQEQWATAIVRTRGGYWALCRSLDDVEAQLQEWGVVLQASIASSIVSGGTR